MRFKIGQYTLRKICWIQEVRVQSRYNILNSFSYLISEMLKRYFDKIKIKIIIIKYAFITLFKSNILDRFSIKSDNRISKGFLSTLSADLRASSVPSVPASWSLRAFSVPSVPTSVQTSGFLQSRPHGLSVPLRVSSRLLIVSGFFSLQ